jgi:hypothetical protein
LSGWEPSPYSAGVSCGWGGEKKSGVSIMDKRQLWYIAFFLVFFIIGVIVNYPRKKKDKDSDETRFFKE